MHFHTIQNLITLLTLDSKVIGPPGIVYSTQPSVSVGADGKTYFIKGWDSDTAFSEVAGCLLAAEAGIRVPPAAVCSFEGRSCAGVEEVTHAVRSIAPWLKNSSSITNGGDLYSVIAVDTWLANDDRNMGNLVGSAAGDGKLVISMIDFEKSRTLGRNPIISSANVESRRFWPTGELGQWLRRTKPQNPPETAIRAIEGIPRERIDNIVRTVAEELPFVDWFENSIDVLVTRSRHIRALLEDVWRAN